MNTTSVSSQVSDSTEHSPLAQANKTLPAMPRISSRKFFRQ